MTECTLDSSAVEWVMEHPETLALLEGLGIDCSCAGKSLGYECVRRGLDARVILSGLHRAIGEERGLRE